MRFFEDITPGERHELGSHTFTAEEIIRFAQKYDRQVFHLDEEQAKATAFGGLIASGWHTIAVFMRLFVAFTERTAAELGAAGAPVARLGPSPGFDNLSWRKPVYADDTISYAMTLADKRVLSSRPGWGLIVLDNEAVNQHGVTVMAFTGKSFLQRRPD